MDWKLPAGMQNVEQVCSAAGQALEQYAVPGKDRFAIQLLLREALNNAVIHGCQHDPLLSFSCRLLISEQEVTLEISDEGTGFDWRTKPKNLPGSANETGRGLPIYALYAHAIIFNNEGNGVTLTRIFNRGEKDD